MRSAASRPTSISHLEYPSRGGCQTTKSKRTPAVGLLIFPPPTIHNPTEEPFNSSAQRGVHPAEGVEMSRSSRETPSCRLSRSGRSTPPVTGHPLFPRVYLQRLVRGKPAAICSNRRIVPVSPSVSAYSLTYTFPTLSEPSRPGALVLQRHRQNEIGPCDQRRIDGPSPVGMTDSRSSRPAGYF